VAEHLPRKVGTPPGRERKIDEADLRRIVVVGGVILIAVLILGFIIDNSHGVRVSFVFFSSQISLIWVILLTFVLGVIVGFLVAVLVRRRYLRQ
jgi:uncharacterized integral membrane protein